jgi:hypothetical protein
MKKIVLMMMLAALLGFFSGCRSETFEGESIESDSTFSLDYSYLNESREHSLFVAQGGHIDVDIESESGHIDVYVYDSAENTIYQGNDAATSSFRLEIAEAGNYRIVVTGEKAAGKASFVAVN